MRYLILFYIIFVLFSCSDKKEVIGIQKYDFFEEDIIDTIKITLQKTFNETIVILPERCLPSKAFVNMKSPRYRADSLLKDLKINKPDSIDFVIGLTKRDISVTKRDKRGNIRKPISKYSDWGVFGLGYKPGPSCIVSSFRLNINDKKFISRLKKVCIHELGHNYGLKHCPVNNCVMQDAAENNKDN